MKVTRILHASVNVSGRLPETQRFYTDVLGLADAERPEIPGVPGHWFTVGDGQLHLVGADALGKGIDPIGDHYCVGVEDLDAAIAELEAEGIEYLRATQGDVVQVWVTDPAGNTVELQQDTA